MKYLLVLVIFCLSGCSPNLMVKSQIDTPPEIKEEYATIVFMRSSFVASAVGAELYEIKDGEISLVGGIPNATKIYHVTTPGRKIYMAHGNAADFMIADVVAGKTYYAIVRPNWGSGAFIPTPIRTDGTTDYNTDIPEFETWRSSTTLMQKKPEADDWLKENKAKIEEIYNRYWTKFDAKSDVQKQQRTLNPGDGI